MDYVDGITLKEAWPEMTGQEKSNPSTSGTSQTTRAGPFSTEADFNDWLLSDLFLTTPQLFRDEFGQRMRADHRLVFTHGDLALHNIIVQHDRIVALLDWGCAGWYAEHWDFLAAGPQLRDWYEYATVVFPQTYFDEFFLSQLLARYQRP
ncbi:hypothetical protein K490DRAFT_58363 [Saccharata proteae CBS 121410]|uniref:Aminoglycoside phosphotransferase domain-containing protein n=1 Tax=Saccharata proteae CBS 121410 TaxID=1314787 RepID=A0A9P4LY83_9PEZI|nr:hypothetical protein K490DRAFT_58363 [Saccharata proteae CBS 121410]